MCVSRTDTTQLIQHFRTVLKISKNVINVQVERILHPLYWTVPTRLKSKLRIQNVGGRKPYIQMGLSSSYYFWITQGILIKPSCCFISTTHFPSFTNSFTRYRFLVRPIRLLTLGLFNYFGFASYILKNARSIFFLFCNLCIYGCYIICVRNISFTYYFS